MRANRSEKGWFKARSLLFFLPPVRLHIHLIGAGSMEQWTMGIEQMLPIDRWRWGQQSDSQWSSADSTNKRLLDWHPPPKNEDALLDIHRSLWRSKMVVMVALCRVNGEEQWGGSQMKKSNGISRQWQRLIASRCSARVIPQPLSALAFGRSSFSCFMWLVIEKTRERENKMTLIVQIVAAETVNFVRPSQSRAGDEWWRATPESKAAEGWAKQTQTEKAEKQLRE